METDSTGAELAALRRQLAEQAEELERLRTGTLSRPSRRALLTGSAAMAGGVLAAGAAGGTAATTAHAAPGHDIVYPVSGETVHLFLEADGIAVPGDSTQVSLGRQNSIECFYLQQKTRTVARKSGGTMVRYDDVVIRKRVDKASPLLAKAHETKAKLTGSFKFFRPNPSGDGTTEQFFTIAFTGGQMRWQDIFLPDLAAAGARGEGGSPPFEEVGMRLTGLSWTYSNGGITWGGSAG